MDQAQLALDSAYHAWVMNNKRRRYLLLGTDLRNVTRQRANLRLGENAEDKNRFIDISIQRKKMIQGMSVVVAASVFVLSYFGLGYYSDYQHRSYLKALNLPRDLFDYQTQLRSLEIDRPITELGWLRADLKSLTLRSKALASLQGLPELPSLQTLVLSQTQIASLQGLPELPSLQTLDLSETQIASLQGLPELPSLQTLVLSGPQIASLQGLPELPVLKEVILGGYSLQSLEGLPPTVAGLIFELKTRPGSA